MNLHLHEMDLDLHLVYRCSFLSPESRSTSKIYLNLARSRLRSRSWGWNLNGVWNRSRSTCIFIISMSVTCPKTDSSKLSS